MARANRTLDILRSLAPGTPLRNAIELILRQDSGALIVLGYGPDVERICTGGFHLHRAEFSAARLAELSKMDGAVVIDPDKHVIARANVHLIPDPTIDTGETGTRHRTAERAAVQTGCPVVVVSEGRSTVTVFTAEGKQELRTATTLLAQANQNLLTLERFQRRLGEAEGRLTHLEIDDIVTYRDVVLLLQRAALIRRLGRDLERHAVELGGEGDLIRIQLMDLLHGVLETAELVYADYAKTHPPENPQPLDLLAELNPEELSDAGRVATLVGLVPLDAAARSRGFRMLDRIPRLPDSVKNAVVDHFGTLQQLLVATVGQLDEVEGVGRTRARQLRHYFDRLVTATGGWDIDDE